MNEDFYRDLAADYDKVIRWERRLKNERPQFDLLWKKFGTRSVLDASCGTGHHLVLFASMGLDAHGCDASQAMVEQARHNASGVLVDVGSRIICCRWDELKARVSRRFDAVLCIGNSLPYLTDHRALPDSLKGLWSKVGHGGVLLIQFKNFGKLISEQQRFLPLSWSEPPEETVALRLYDYHAGRVDFNVILLTRRGSEWQLRHQVTGLRPYTPEEVSDPLREIGARVSIFGGLSLEPFDVAKSEDVLILACHPEQGAF